MDRPHPLKIYRENQTPPLSQSALAEKLAVARNTVARWERGELIPNKSSRAVIGRITGIPPIDLVNGRGAE